MDLDTRLVNSDIGMTSEKITQTLRDIKFETNTPNDPKMIWTTMMLQLGSPYILYYCPQVLVPFYVQPFQSYWYHLLVDVT